jgi:hypothetical protein
VQRGKLVGERGILDHHPHHHRADVGPVHQRVAVALDQPDSRSSSEQSLGARLATPPSQRSCEQISRTERHRHPAAAPARAVHPCPQDVALPQCRVKPVVRALATASSTSPRGHAAPASSARPGSRIAHHPLAMQGQRNPAPGAAAADCQSNRSASRLKGSAPQQFGLTPVDPFSRIVVVQSERKIINGGVTRPLTDRSAALASPICDLSCRGSSTPPDDRCDGLVDAARPTPFLNKSAAAAPASCRQRS